MSLKVRAISSKTYPFTEHELLKQDRDFLHGKVTWLTHVREENGSLNLNFRKLTLFHTQKRYPDTQLHYVTQFPRLETNIYVTYFI